MAIKLTGSRLQQIIKEEVKRLLEYEQSLICKNGKTYIRDDEGNEEYLDSHPYMHGLHNDGESVPYETRGSYGGGSSADGYSRSGYGRSRYGRRRW